MRVGFCSPSARDGAAQSLGNAARGGGLRGRGRAADGGAAGFGGVGRTSLGASWRGFDGTPTAGGVADRAARGGTAGSTLAFGRAVGSGGGSELGVPVEALAVAVGVAVRSGALGRAVAVAATGDGAAVALGFATTGLAAGAMDTSPLLPIALGPGRGASSSEPVTST